VGLDGDGGEDEGVAHVDGRRVTPEALVRPSEQIAHAIARLAWREARATGGRRPDERRGGQGVHRASISPVARWLGRWVGPARTPAGPVRQPSVARAVKRFSGGPPAKVARIRPAPTSGQSRAAVGLAGQAFARPLAARRASVRHSGEQYTRS
jgi:hypothetical protein